MPLQHFVGIKGKFVVVGYEPDGDSVRFIADNPSAFDSIYRSHLIRFGKNDNSVQLRFDGIDAPELHYGAAKQPLGATARDRLLKMMGFTGVQYTGTKATSSKPAGGVRGAILTAIVETHGRPVSYALSSADASFNDGDVVDVDGALLSKTFNYRMAASGDAYPLLYTSTPKPHRVQMRQAAAAARSANKGVWADDASASFTLIDETSISPPNGQLIFPKLFRRCTDYLKEVAKTGFSGNVTEWMQSHATDSRQENDQVLTGTLDEGNPSAPRPVQVAFSQLILQENATISFQPDLLDVVFVEK